MKKYLLILGMIFISALSFAQEQGVGIQADEFGNAPEGGYIFKSRNSDGQFVIVKMDSILNDSLKGVDTLYFKDDSLCFLKYDIEYCHLIPNTGSDTQHLYILNDTLWIDNGNGIALTEFGNQTLSISGNDLSISQGNTVTINPDDADHNPINEIQYLSINNNVLSITQGNSINLPGLSDTSTQAVFVDTIYINNDLLCWMKNGLTHCDSLPEKDYQLLSIDSLNRVFELTLSNGNSVKWKDEGGYWDKNNPYNVVYLADESTKVQIGENTAGAATYRLNVFGTTYMSQNLIVGQDAHLYGDLVLWQTPTINNNADSVLVWNKDNNRVEMRDISTIGSDDQILSLSGNTLTLEDGGSVDLSGYLDNTDDQTITDFSFDSGTNILTLTLEDGNTATVNLAALIDDDADATNEIQTITLDSTSYPNLRTYTLHLTDGGDVTWVDSVGSGGGSSIIYVDTIYRKQDSICYKKNTVEYCVIADTSLWVTDANGIHSKSYRHVGIGEDANSSAILTVQGRADWNDGGQSVFIGDAAGKYDDLSNNRNVGIGFYTLSSNTTGAYNMGVGYQALYKNRTGNSNLAIGYKALILNVSGVSNTSLGYFSGGNIVNGSYNTFIGSNSGYNCTGSLNTFIGYNSGINEIGSNKLYIDNSSTSTPLIYGKFDSDTLRINGSLQIRDVATDNTLENILVQDASNQEIKTRALSTINTDNQQLGVNNNDISITNGNTITVPDTNSVLNQDSILITYSKGVELRRDTIRVASSVGGDNWGTQVVEHDASLIGDGTSANTLKLNPIPVNTWDDSHQFHLPDANGSALTFDGVGDISVTTPSNGSHVVQIAYTGSAGTDDQTLSFSNPNLSIEDGNSVNLSAINTDNQNLSTDNTPGNISISGGNNITLNVQDNDSDPSNEIEGAFNIGGYAEVYKDKIAPNFRFRTLQSSDASITITENANDIDLTLASAGSSYWNANGSDIYNNNSGYVGINTNSPDQRFHVFGTGATRIKIEGGGSGYIQSGLLFETNNTIRGAGSFAHNSSGGYTWFWGQPYNSSDAFSIGRYTGGGTDAASDITNSLMKIDNQGFTTHYGDVRIENQTPQLDFNRNDSYDWDINANSATIFNIHSHSSSGIVKIDNVSTPSLFKYNVNSSDLTISESNNYKTFELLGSHTLKLYGYSNSPIFEFDAANQAILIDDGPGSTGDVITSTDMSGTTEWKSTRNFARAHNTATQTIASSGVWTVLQYDTEDFEENAVSVNSVDNDITLNEEGYYRIEYKAVVTMPMPSTGYLTEMKLYRGFTAMDDTVVSQDIDANDTATLHYSTIVYNANASDWGVRIKTEANAEVTHFTISASKIHL